MIDRLLNPSKQNHFFLFGARGTGKTTLLSRWFPDGPDILKINLLDLKTEDRFRSNPDELKQQIQARKQKGGTLTVIIDEVQKLPKLLDAVHLLIEERAARFILTGSSARKLKRGGANLLAGRAFTYFLYPLTALELGESFSLMDALNWGALPKLLELTEKNDREDFLNSYVLTYLKEEIQVEQLVRNLDPFRLFLDVAAAANGQIVNFSKIARDCGVDTTTVQNYYSILEDTLIGFFLEPSHRSVRKRQRGAPKFYFFDGGVVRSLTRSIGSPLVPQTGGFGAAFEHFLILEIKRRAEYLRKNWKFSYLRTKDDAEIDLIIDLPGNEGTICIEIKSAEHIREDHLSGFAALAEDVKGAKLYCFSRDPSAKVIRNVSCLPWAEGLKRIGLV